jgi:hypothetical protein
MHGIYTRCEEHTTEGLAKNFWTFMLWSMITSFIRLSSMLYSIDKWLEENFALERVGNGWLTNV